MERRHQPRQPARPLVLFVDGHEDTRELYATALPTFGFETVTADDGALAFLRAWETHPDIIVTELALPGLDGWQLCESLKQDMRTRDIPIVVLTARAESTVRERATRAGCATIFVKPCLPEQLAGGLRRLLDRNDATN